MATLVFVLVICLNRTHLCKWVVPGLPYQVWPGKLLYFMIASASVTLSLRVVASSSRRTLEYNLLAIVVESKLVTIKESRLFKLNYISLYHCSILTCLVCPFTHIETNTLKYSTFTNTTYGQGLSVLHSLVIRRIQLCKY